MKHLAALGIVLVTLSACSVEVGRDDERDSTASTDQDGKCFCDPGSRGIDCSLVR